MGAGVLQWSHEDAAGLHNTAVEAFAAAKAQRWPEGEAGNRLFRAWLVSIVGTLAALGETPMQVLSSPDETKPRYRLAPSSSSRPENRDWQETLGTGLIGIVAGARLTPEQLALPSDQTLVVTTVAGDAPKLSAEIFPAAAPPPSSSPTDFTLADLATFEQLAPFVTGDTGQIGIWEGIVIVAVAGIIGGALGWTVSMGAETVSLGITQQNKTTQAIAAMSSSNELLEQHLAKEKDAGKAIPYTSEELSQLATLRETITKTTGWTPPPLSSVPNVRKVSESLGTGAGLGTFVVLAAIGLAYWQSHHTR